MEQKEVCANLMLKLNELRLGGHFCDIILMVNGTSISAHKVVLAAGSEFFKAVFQKDSGTLVYQINGIDSEAMLCVLDFMYTGQVSLSKGNVFLMKAIGDQLKIKSLVDQCRAYESQAKRTKKLKKAKKARLAAAVAAAAEKTPIKTEVVEKIVEGADGDTGDAKSVYVTIISDGSDPSNIRLLTKNDGEPDDFEEDDDDMDVDDEAKDDASKENVHFHDYCGSGEPSAQTKNLKVPKNIKIKPETDVDMALIEALEECLEDSQITEKKKMPVQKPGGRGMARRCPWCDSEDTFNKKTFVAHAKAHHPECLFKCFDCEKLFLTKDKCVDHNIRCIVGDPDEKEEFKCPICDGEKTYFNKMWNAMMHHFKAEHGDTLKRAQCSKCQEAFETELEVKDHLLTAHQMEGELKVLECESCSLKTVIFDKFNRTHKCRKRNPDIDKPAEELSCVICSKTFSFKTSLRKHIRLQHANLDPPHKCNMCTFSSKYAKGLTYHMYKRHRFVSTDTKIYFCPYCDYSNTNLPDLRKHERYKHSDDKPYLCSYCDTRFKNKAHLKNHLRIHTGDKPFKCKVCTYAARTSTDLVRHERRMHSTEYRYFCDCGYKSKVNTNMWFHKKRCKHVSAPGVPSLNNVSFVQIAQPKDGEEMNIGTAFTITPETEMVIQQASQALAQVQQQEDQLQAAQVISPYQVQQVEALVNQTEGQQDVLQQQHIVLHNIQVQHP